MVDFLKANIANIILILGFLGILLTFVKIGNKRQARKMALYLVMRAEKKYGGGTGDLKYSEVATMLYERLPSIGQALLTAKDIDEIIESGVEAMKQLLTSGKNIEDYERYISEE